MGYTSRAIIVLSLLAAACFAFSFYLSKYHKEPIATIELDKGGCFGHSSYRLSILHKENSVVARLDSGDNIIAQALISTSQLDSFRVFIQELKEMKDGGGCTNYEIYKVYYKNTILKKENWSCSWQGFKKLLNSFYGKLDQINSI